MVKEWACGTGEAIPGLIRMANPAHHYGRAQEDRQ